MAKEYCGIVCNDFLSSVMVRSNLSETCEKSVTFIKKLFITFIKIYPTHLLHQTCNTVTGHILQLKKWPLVRVATAQGKQGIWLLTFPDRENTGN